MKNPKVLCTVRIATTMLTAIPNAAIRVRKPRMSPSPPKNSAAITRKASGAGMCIMPIKTFIVAEYPQPPNHPNIFCAPCAKKTIPSTSLRISVAVLLSVANSLRIIFYPLSKSGCVLVIFIDDSPDAFCSVCKMDGGLCATLVLGVYKRHVRKSHETQNVAQVRFLKIVGFLRRAFFVGAAAGSDHDNFLFCEKALRAVRPIGDRLAEPHNLIDPRFKRRRDGEVYIGAPMTTVSAAWSSSISSSEVARYDRSAAVRFESSIWVAAQASVITGIAVTERSRRMTSPSGWFSLQCAANFAVSRLVTELVRALESI